MPNEQIIGDVEGAIAYLRGQADSNGKVGVIGFCSGGRQAYLAACEIPIERGDRLLGWKYYSSW